MRLECNRLCLILIILIVVFNISVFIFPIDYYIANNNDILIVVYDNDYEVINWFVQYGNLTLISTATGTKLYPKQPLMLYMSLVEVG